MPVLPRWHGQPCTGHCCVRDLGQPNFPRSYPLREQVRLQRWFLSVGLADSPKPVRPRLERQAPLSSTFSTVGGLRCSNCHDPHGTPNYRNLLSDPNPAFAGAVDVLLGTDVREIVPVNPDVPNAAQAYDAGNIAFYTTNRINTWCTDCLDQLASATVGSLPAHFMRHPVGVDLSGANYGHVNTSNWISGAIGASTGFGTDLEDAVAGVPRLRYGSPSGSNSTASTGDTVLCLTCHKAHGSKYRSGLVWPFRLDASDSRSGCQQCHYQ